MKVAIIGGGAAGFFATINAKANYPNAEVTLYEKSNKLLAKVRISGGGRCNVTNGTRSIKELCDGYPRGGKMLKKVFSKFNTKDTWEWFESRGVPLKIEEDGRVFPQSNNSESIIDCLIHESKKLKVKILTTTPVEHVIPKDGKWMLTFKKGLNQEEIFDKVIIATGGSPKRHGLEWLEDLGHKIIDPVPSLFTFNIPSEQALKKLMGLSVPQAIVSIQGTRLKAQGPLLITHWGMSGPAVLRISSFGARILHESHYRFTAQINWVGEQNHDKVRDDISALERSHGRKQLSNIRPFGLPERMWLYLLVRVEIPIEKPWGELGKKGINKLTTILTNDQYQVSGKTTFKEEFVTAGGVSLDSIHSLTMESNICPNLYFAGEVLDIDGITGGYNFQAAWTTSFIAGQLS